MPYEGGSFVAQCKYLSSHKACFNFIQHFFESSFRGCFPVFPKSIGGYATNKKRETERKETQKKLNKKLFEEILNRLLLPNVKKKLYLQPCTQQKLIKKVIIIN